MHAGHSCLRAHRHSTPRDTRAIGWDSAPVAWCHVRDLVDRVTVGWDDARVPSARTSPEADRPALHADSARLRADRGVRSCGHHSRCRGHHTRHRRWLHRRPEPVVEQHCPAPMDIRAGIINISVPSGTTSHTLGQRGRAPGKESANAIALRSSASYVRLASRRASAPGHVTGSRSGGRSGSSHAVSR